MQNKFRFMMPRLIGATVVAGLAALIITTLFKLLLAATLLAGVAGIIIRQAGKRYHRYLNQYGQESLPGLGKRNTLGSSHTWANQMISITGTTSQKPTTIIPVN